MYIVALLNPEVSEWPTFILTQTALPQCHNSKKLLAFYSDLIRIGHGPRLPNLAQMMVFRAMGE